jgi:hypothetical protein
MSTQEENWEVFNLMCQRGLLCKNPVIEFLNQASLILKYEGAFSIHVVEELETYESILHHFGVY